MQGSITRRATAVAGAAVMTAALSVAGAGVAQAHGNSNKCGRVSVTFSLDGGQSWTTDGRINGDTAPASIIVKLSDTPAKGCSYHVSLASYSAEGPDWASSGTQALLGWDTATLDAENTQAALNVPAPSCFGQVDLYGNGKKYDGTGGNALPHYPDSATPPRLITAWNGGAPCTTPTPTPTPTDTGTPTPTPTPTGTDTPTPTPTPTDTGTPTPTPTPTGTDTPTPTPTPSDTGTPTPSPSVSDSSSPSPAPTTSAASGGGSTTPPTGSPVVSPVSTTPTGNLAETGGNGSQTVAFAGGGAALLVIGGGAVYFTRRRNRTAGN
ncbi:LAETG motif-containing sortase-dependent surface protein [Streptomyces polygonati]|uniref:LAETG motif-containing sortase-dependent surface protein n=1 Tax=Streptomyces polygonati TaxID=1617087 RepID=A0ABV8HGK1_9ACTN